MPSSVKARYFRCSYCIDDDRLGFLLAHEQASNNIRCGLVVRPTITYSTVCGCIRPRIEGHRAQVFLLISSLEAFKSQYRYASISLAKSCREMTKDDRGVENVLLFVIGIASMGFWLTVKRLGAFSLWLKLRF